MRNVRRVLGALLLLGAVGCNTAEADSPPPYTARTVDDSTWVTILSMPLTPNQGVVFYATVFASLANGDGAFSGCCVARWTRVGAAAPMRSAAVAMYYGDLAGPEGNPPFANDPSLAASRVRHVADGDSVLMQVKGVNAPVNWKVETPSFITFFDLP